MHLKWGQSTSVLLLWLLSSILSPAWAVGYHLVKLEATRGMDERSAVETGVGVSLYSDDLDWFMTLGDPELDEGHRIKECWLRSRYRGPVMGILPEAFGGLGEEGSTARGPRQFLIPYRFWSLGTDHSSMRKLEWDWSSHVVFNTGAFSRLPSWRFLFGPSMGFGLNLTWWDQWKDVTEKTINTGKITLEAGWLLGFSWGDSLYSQARATGHLDLFGIHQTNLNLAGIAGFFLSRFKIPLGMELSFSMDSGNDTYDTQQATLYTIMGSINYRLLPPRPDPRIQLPMDSMQKVNEPTGDTPPVIEFDHPGMSGLDHGEGPGDSPPRVETASHQLQWEDCDNTGSVRRQHAAPGGPSHDCQGLVSGHVNDVCRLQESEHPDRRQGQGADGADVTGQ